MFLPSDGNRRASVSFVLVRPVYLAQDSFATT